MQRIHPHIPACLSASAALIVLLCLPVAGRSAERIVLTNGFDMPCHHHLLVGERVRVFLRPGDTDYVELRPEAIAAVETVPDPPDAEPPESAAKPAAIPGQTGFRLAGLGQTGDLRNPQPGLPAGSGKVNADSRLTPEDLHQLLSPASAEHNVDEDLLASVIKMESGGHTRARSHAGAQGLMQLMPATARQLGVTDSFAPEQNVRGGSAYLDSLLTRYHDNIVLALAAYNAGPGAVDRYHGVPPYQETRVYVARVIHEFNRRVALRRVSRAAVAMQSQRLGSE